MARRGLRPCGRLTYNARPCGWKGFDKDMPIRHFTRVASLLRVPTLLALLTTFASAHANAETPAPCTHCAEWNVSQEPFRIYGSFATLSALPCDLLLTPHPEVSDLWKRIDRRDKGGDANALVDSTACRRLADTSRANLEKRVAGERVGEH